MANPTTRARDKALDKAPGRRTGEVNNNSEDDDDVPQHSQPAPHDAGAPRGCRGTDDRGTAGALRRPASADGEPEAHDPDGTAGSGDTGGLRRMGRERMRGRTTGPFG